MEEFFDITKPIKKTIVPGCTLVKYKNYKLNTIKKEIRENSGTNYAKQVKQKQKEKTKKNLELNTKHNNKNKTIKKETENEKYPNEKEKNTYNKILEQIQKSPVLIIQGKTGCGKSTKVPQIILNDAYNRGENCNIVITQPNHLATMKLSEQISKERESLEGYHKGLDKKKSENTKITYCTPKTLLEKLIQPKGIDMYTHIILDEIHERDIDMELLLIIIKLKLDVNPFKTKIIIMSATIDTKQFAKHFNIPNADGKITNAPVLTLTGHKQHDVNVFYLDDLIKVEKLNSFVNYNQPDITPQMYKIACNIIENFSTSNSSDEGFGVLLFLPGIQEIKKMYLTLETERKK